MFKNNLKISLRNLQRYKSYAVINVLGLALSIACCILIFTFVRYHLGFDNFHGDSARIYRIVTEVHRKDNVHFTPGVPAPLGGVFRNDYTYAEKVARIVSFSGNLITIEQGKGKRMFKEKMGVAFCESEFFDIFNFPLMKGNSKTALTEPNTAIITESISNKYFGDSDPINRIFRINNQIDFKITGVLKDFPGNTDFKESIYLSYPTLKLYSEELASNESWGGVSSEMQCFVKLRPFISPPLVERALFTYVKKYRPDSKNIHHYLLQPISDMHFNPHYEGVMPKSILWAFSFVSLILLIAACVNFVNLATAQALKRSKEVGVRKVLGGFRAQIFWQFISETGVITVFAVVLALCLSMLALPFVNNWLNFRMSINPVADWQLSSFIAVLIFMVSFLAGFYPGIIMAGFQPVIALKGKISQLNIGGFNTRRTLIIAQFTISQILIIGMIVVASQMRYAKDSDLGFNKEGIVLLPVAGAKMAAMHTLRDRLVKSPGVRDISLCLAPPSYLDNWKTAFKYNNSIEDENFPVTVRAADDKYLSTFDLKLIAGRNIFHSDSVREFLVNESFAKKLNLKSADQVIGKTISINGGKIAAPVVGVVKDFHDGSFHDDINAVCISSMASSYQYYAVKINMTDVGATLSALEKTWSEMNPNQVYEFHFLDEQIAQFYKIEDFMLKLIEVFAFIAIFIGCLGLYGLISFMVSQKRKEIGIRKILGGKVQDVLWIFGKEFSRLILIALLIAAPLGWLLMNNWLRLYQFHIEIGLWVFISTLMISIAVALLAGGYQAIKAAIVKPALSLRTDA
jgi:putative ABC transport system permease protein